MNDIYYRKVVKLTEYMLKQFSENKEIYDNQIYSNFFKNIIFPHLIWK